MKGYIQAISGILIALFRFMFGIIYMIKPSYVITTNYDKEWIELEGEDLASNED